MWSQYICVSHPDEAVALLNKYQQKARIVAGATDLLLEIERGARKEIDVLIDITRVPGLQNIWIDSQGLVHLGPLVTHNDCVRSDIIQKYAFPLAQAAWEVGSPQIRNRGTIAGNIITASPANDTITPLLALGATVKLISSEGERVVPLREFYKGVRATIMRPNEIMADIFFAKMDENQRGIFIKFALRRAQAIALVNIAVILKITLDIIDYAKITLGAVAPTIIHAREAEEYLLGKSIKELNIEFFGKLVMNAGRPINDIRGSAAYRRKMIRVLAVRAMDQLISKKEKDSFPKSPVILNVHGNNHHQALVFAKEFGQQSEINTTINGRKYNFRSGHDKSLLRLLREDAQLIGTKEGCSEGECGACTVYLDGAAVMSCLVPAARADGAEITTIEGLAQRDELHPVQQAFIDAGAVQCGYCIPGFIMSAAKLLDEKPTPSRLEIQHALTGNLCRCTGYYKIIEAVENSAMMRLK